MKSVALHNLGCKVNAYEIDVMVQMLQERGYKIVPFDKKADIYIVNTCTVTNIADRKSRQMLHRAKKLNPAAVVVAVGCYVQAGGEEALRDECIDLAVGNNKKKDLADILEHFLAQREHRSKTLSGTSVINIDEAKEYEQLRLKRTADHTRAYIKIQDGCNQFCSYCIIPHARGRVRSRRPEEVLEEIRGLVREGYQEFVLTGIHISSYGIDFEQGGEGDYLDARSRAFEKGHLLKLIRSVHAQEGVERLRLGSLEPRIVTEGFAAALGAMPKICPHFHLSLQSGCDATLKRMNRHYLAGEYYEKVKLLRSIFENPAITTDVIVGFPQETEEEFEETRAFLKKVGFYEMHIFKYSRRNHTPAAAMSGQVPEEIKAQRSRILLELEKEQSAGYRKGLLGSSREVLFEESKEIEGVSYLVGHTREYVKAAKRTREESANRIAKGRLTGFLTDEILLIE